MRSDRISHFSGALFANRLTPVPIMLECTADDHAIDGPKVSVDILWRYPGTNQHRQTTVSQRSQVILIERITGMSTGHNHPLSPAKVCAVKPIIQGEVSGDCMG